MNFENPREMWARSFNCASFFRLRCDTRIVAAPGAIEHLAPLVADLGTRALVIVDERVYRLPSCGRGLARLERSGTVTVHPLTAREPRTADVAALHDEIRSRAPDVLVAVGGGSVLDVVKATRRWDPGDGSMLVEPAPAPGAHAPIVAVPTTAGSGADTSRFVALIDDGGAKAGYRSWDFCPEVSVVDPGLGSELTPRQILAHGLDCLVHFYEAYVAATERSVLTDGLCSHALDRMFGLLPAAVARPDETDVRFELAVLASLAGIVLSHVRLGLIHRCGEAVAGTSGQSHPESLAVFLRRAVELNDPHTRELPASGSGFGERFAPIERLLDGHGLGRIDPARIEPVWGSLDAMVDEVLSDATLLEENPAPLDRESLARLFRTSIEEHSGHVRA